MNSLRVAFIGQSVGSHAFSAEFYSAATKYCEQNGILKASIVLADDPHRFSFMALRNMEEAEAISATAKISIEKFKFLQKIAGKHRLFTIHRWNEFSAFPAFERIHRAVDAEYQTGDMLRDAIIRRFLEHAGDATPTSITDRRSVDLGSKYIIAELALMLLMYGPLGYEVQISPFRAPAFLEVALSCPRIVDLRELQPLRDIVIDRVHVTLSGDAHSAEVVQVRIAV